MDLEQDAWDRGYAAGESSGYVKEREAIVEYLKARGMRLLAETIERGDHLLDGSGTNSASPVDGAVGNGCGVLGDRLAALHRDINLSYSVPLYVLEDAARIGAAIEHQKSLALFAELENEIYYALRERDSALARTAELESFIESNTTVRDGVRYSKSVAFEGCKRCFAAGVASRARGSKPSKL